MLQDGPESEVRADIEAVRQTLQERVLARNADLKAGLAASTSTPARNDN